MTFFHQAIQDGTIDSKVEMNEKEFEMMLRGMIQDSNAWEMHKSKHHDANIVPIFNEETKFENKVNEHSNRREEPSVIQYDMHSKKFVAGCNCGERFEIDVKNDKVEMQSPALKMKEISGYDRGNDGPSGSSYGNGSNNAPSQGYSIGPAQSHNSAYNSSNSSGYRN